MDKRRKYFIKQKLIGVAVLALSIVSVVLAKDAGFAFFGLPLGLLLIFTKQMFWMDDYFCETHRGSTKEEEEF